MLATLASLLVFAPACDSPIPEKDSENFKSAVSAFYVGLAATQVGNDQRAAVELEKAVKLASGEPAAWNNLGVLQLRQKDFENAGASLKKANGLLPENALIVFNQAILAQQQGDSEAMVANLTKARELDEKDLRPLYLLAVENEKQQKDKEAIANFDAVLKVQPDNLAALVEAARLKAKTGDKQGFASVLDNIGKQSATWPDEAIDQFAKLKASAPEQAATEVAFLRNVLLRVPVFRASLEKIKPSDTVIGDLMTKPVKLETPDFSPAEPDTAITFSIEPHGDKVATATAAVFLNGTDKPVTAISDETETTVGKQALPFSFDTPDQIAVFDFDYDYKNDIAFAGKSGFKLFKQIESGSFEDVTAKAGVQLPADLSGVWSFDFDSEGDLDLVVAAESELIALRNNGNGTFEITKPFEGSGRAVDFEVADIDEDGDSDAVVLLDGGSVVLYKNERGGVFKKGDSPLFADALAIAVADTNGDGKLDVNAQLKNGNVMRLDDSGFTKPNPAQQITSTSFNNCQNFCIMLVADIDNNGANDLVLSANSRSQIFLGTSGGKFVKAEKEIAGEVSGYADFNADGKLDLSGTRSDGKPATFINKSAKPYHWQILRPKSVKTDGDQRINTFGIGGEIEMRSGLLAQKQLIRTPFVHFGLGTNTTADVARIVWQNGYVQAEFDLKADQMIAAEQRLKGSCPHLFAWNGTEFAYVKDAPPWSPALGLKINAQDTYGILQTEEWFKIPGEALQPKNGAYELRITGEYWEAFYIDHYRLMAVDHPEGTEVFTDERFAIPLPPLEVFTTEATKLFKSAVDHNGKDVLDTVSKIDEKYLDGIKRGKYQGVAEDHYVELELPVDAPLDKKLWVLGDGWMHPTDASINVQRGQDLSRPPKSLSIEVQDKNGEWQTAKDNLGFPAGKMKTVLLDLEGVFDKNPDSRKIRIRTELEVFWDKLAWGVDVKDSANQTTEIELQSAELRYRGFSVMEKPDDSSPEVPDYKRVMTTSQRWRDLEGYFTRYGDIKELLLKTDDRFLLTNAGDEIVMRFPALPPVKSGYKRDFVIIGNGWIKDGDLNSEFSKTVLPLPTQASNDYSRPPTRLEDDPVYQKNRADWINFHTRYVSPDGFRNAVRGN